MKGKKLRGKKTLVSVFKQKLQNLNDGIYFLISRIYFIAFALKPIQDTVMTIVLATLF